MEDTTRRTALGLVGGGIGAMLAGCLGDLDGDDDPGSDGDPGTDTTTDDPADTTTAGEPTTTDEPTTADPAGDLVDATTLQLGTSLSTDWWVDDASPPGRVVAMGSRERTEAVLDPESLPSDARDRVTSFLDETSFDESLLLLVESVGPSTCYAEVAVEDARIEGDSLRASATAVDTSEGAGCGGAVTFPSALVRATVDGTPPTAATITVTNGWGDSAEIGASVDDPIALDPEDLAGSVRPNGDPATVPPALDCEDDSFRRHPGAYDDPAWGLVEEEGAPAFALRTDATAAEYGDTVTITMTNVTGRDLYTGNRHKYNLEVLTEDGWQDVRGTATDQPFEYTDEAVSHVPGKGFEWTIELTEEGVVDGHYHEDHMSVCPDLPAGRYRFVYWEPSVAVAFDVTRG